MNCKETKTWDTLYKEFKDVTLNNGVADFATVRHESFADNGWGELDDDGLPIGQYDLDGQDYETSWKIDSVFRLVYDNLDYGQFSGDSTDDLDNRCYIAMDVARDWVFGVDAEWDIEKAQCVADGYISQYRG